MKITWNIVSEAVVLEYVVHVATKLRVEDMIITSQ
jgi:hypothetical protein